MLHDADEAAERLIRFLDSGRMPVLGGDPIPLSAQSICVHGDSPGAVGMAQQVRRRLEGAGITVSPFLP